LPWRRLLDTGAQGHEVIDVDAVDDVGLGRFSVVHDISLAEVDRRSATDLVQRGERGLDALSLVFR
jgi:predicted aspartyl protease